MTRPINELVQFYLHPKTFSQKVKRLWRMQRIFIKMIKLIHMTNALNMAQNGPMDMEAMFKGSMPTNDWMLNNPSVIALNDRSAKKG